MATNCYGLDADYFIRLCAREFSPDVIRNQCPADLARAFARAARTACAEVLFEQEFTAKPQQDALGEQPEAFRKSDALWELDSSIKDLARQSEVEYRARYYAGAVGFLRGLHMMRVVDAEERNRWKVKILEAHLQAIAQCEAARRGLKSETETCSSRAKPAAT